jgi:hypothetical protein
LEFLNHISALYNVLYLRINFSKECLGYVSYRDPRFDLIHYIGFIILSLFQIVNEGHDLTHKVICRFDKLRVPDLSRSQARDELVDPDIETLQEVYMYGLLLEGLNQEMDVRRLSSTLVD